MFLDLEKKEFSNMTITERMQKFIVDENFDKIMKISNLGFEYALSRKEKGLILDKKTCENSLEQMEMLIPKVMDFNKDIAEWYFSEGSVVYMYASGQSDDTSLRFGNIGDKNK